MNLKEDINKIISESIWAPSAENCQPWKFELFEDGVNIFLIPERDEQTWGQRASILAIGSLIENFEIIANQNGYSSAIELFPNSDLPDLVVRIKIQKTEKAFNNTSLYKAIPKRTTNRKPYLTDPLNKNELKELLNIIQTNCEFVFCQDPKKIEIIAESAAGFEKVLFKNEKSHNFFFSHINWNAEEDAKKSIGFYIKTLELPPPAKLLFPLIKNWKVMSVLNKINFADAISKENAKVYKSCAGIGAIFINDNSKESFLHSGRLLQKLWLTLTRMGFSVQPLGGIIFLMLDVLYGQKEKFSSSEIKVLNTSYSNFYKAFNKSENKVLAMLFRVGKSDPASAKSSRLPAFIT